MAKTHKDSELPNQLRIRLAEIDFKSGQDFPMQNQNYFHLAILSVFLPRRKEPNEKKNCIEHEKTLEELNSADPRSQSRFHLVQTIYTKRIKLPLSAPYVKHLFNRACYMVSGTRDNSSPEATLSSVYSINVGFTE